MLLHTDTDTHTIFIPLHNIVTKYIFISTPIPVILLFVVIISTSLGSSTIEIGQHLVAGQMYIVHTITIDFDTCIECTTCLGEIDPLRPRLCLFIRLTTGILPSLHCIDIIIIDVIIDFDVIIIDIIIITKEFVNVINQIKIPGIIDIDFIGGMHLNGTLIHGRQLGVVNHLLLLLFIVHVIVVHIVVVIGGCGRACVAIRLAQAEEACTGSTTFLFRFGIWGALVTTLTVTVTIILGCKWLWLWLFLGRIRIGIRMSLALIDYILFIVFMFMFMFERGKISIIILVVVVIIVIEA
mmetsp:Transcript_24286/g.37108  ORF Transcript_24286/g.37108 Transcript_24286/m.37108 type:complete len:296 (+) Transcript_24286:2302-3189(+)